MAFWKSQLPQAWVNENWNVSAPTAPGATSVTPGASGSWGSYTLVDTAAAGRDAYWVDIGYTSLNSSGADRRMLMEVAVYDSSTYHSQVVGTIGSNSAHDWSGGTTSQREISLPIFVKAGNRIAVRAMYHTTSPPNLSIYCRTYGAQDFYGHSGGHAIDSVGVDEGNVKGTAVTPNATVNTWGSWTSLDASTDNPYVGAVMFFGLNGSTNYPASGVLRVELGDGTNTFATAGTFYASTLESARSQQRFCWFPNPIPAGTSLQVRVMPGASSMDPVDLSFGMIRR